MKYINKLTWLLVLGAGLMTASCSDNDDVEIPGGLAIDKEQIEIGAEGGSEQLAKEIEQATGVESRATILGHVQRGGSPTVQDRVVASQLGYYAVDLLSKGIGNRVVGLQHNEVVDYDIQEALKMKKEFPHDLYKIANEISF